MNEKALRMLKHVRIQIFGHPARYVVVRESHGDNPAAPRGSLCSDLRQLFAAMYILQSTRTTIMSRAPRKPRSQGESHSD